MKRLLAISYAIIIFSLTASAQSAIVKDFKPVCDSLSTLLTERTGVKGGLNLKKIMKRSGNLDFYFDVSLGDFPLRRGDSDWIRSTLKSLFPEKYKDFSLGGIYSRNIDIKRLEVASLSFKGSSFKSQNRTIEPSDRKKFVTRVGDIGYDKGLSGRNIALWQSHGLIFDNGSGRWDWQRPCLFQTVEDMYTQGYVLPFLAPMLENAGAYLLIPRERDIQRSEVIADNDECLGGRGEATYIEDGRWKSVEHGFGDFQEIYMDMQTPFGMGTARKAGCVRNDAADASEAIWRPDIPHRGEYAVYISYKSLPESSSCAHYKVMHMGGISEFIVNQKLSGDTWVYLGTFEFDKGTEGHVSLSARTPEGYRFERGSVVTADAVKFGGGMGNIARGKEGSEEVSVSGMPRSVEGARYWLQWAGADKKIFHASEEDNDYKDDFMCRGDWVNWLSSEKGVPVDLSFGFHSDAGVTPDDSIIGTLSIYTYESEGKFELPSGESRMTSREYADIVQTQIVHDIRAEFNPDWTRRQLWNRGYRESRTPSSPAMLLELLSHQNFADMKYGHDPEFRFTVSRAIYKGMLKYLSNRYGIPYTVQPLPVEEMAVTFKGEDMAVVSWKGRLDEIEPTAAPTGYIIYTRIDDGAFDLGQVVKVQEGSLKQSHKVKIRPGHMYSFKVEAYNDGGKSFPSETVSIGIPEGGGKDGCKVLVVNNFDRVSGPAYFDTPTYAGFDNSTDSGVPYIRDITFVGEMYQRNRSAEWVTNDNPGFGGSHQDYAGEQIAGNTFDFISIHGKAIMDAGHGFYSCSNESFCSDPQIAQDAWSIDLICGKQVTTVTGNAQGRKRFTIFTDRMQQALTQFAKNGGHILVSGSNIATDIWGQVFPYEVDEELRKSSIAFAEGVLGYRLASGYASRTAEVEFTGCRRMELEAGGGVSFNNMMNEDIYCVETPDGILPRSGSSVFMRYSDTDIPAAICHEGEGYKTVCFGFPVETIMEEDGLEKIISLTFDYFSR